MAGWRGEIKNNAPLARYTSWKVGGPVDRLYRPINAEDLGEFLAQLPADEALLWIGLGSNLLVRDGGFRGTAILTWPALSDLAQTDDGLVFAAAGVTCPKLAKQAAKWGCKNAAFFAGIPGTVGGALAMNAGAHGGETWEHLVAVEMINRQGERTRYVPSDFKVGYRTVVGPEQQWFTAAWFKFPVGDVDVELQGIKQLQAQRAATQPIAQRSCGSVFRNPPGDHAARLIEASGLKGLRIGGASVSLKHANFIVNDAEASATDIEALITTVKKTVAEKFSTELHAEVRMVGEALQC